jgi:hypothetical protein
VIFLSKFSAKGKFCVVIPRFKICIFIHHLLILNIEILSTFKVDFFTKLYTKLNKLFFLLVLKHLIITNKWIKFWTKIWLDQKLAFYIKPQNFHRNLPLSKNYFVVNFYLTGPNPTCSRLSKSISASKIFLTTHASSTPTDVKQALCSIIFELKSISLCCF